MDNYAYCPVPGCDYWVSFGGYFQPFTKQLYSHFKTHTELGWGDRRVPGGLLDQKLGEAVLAGLTKREEKREMSKVKTEECIHHWIIETPAPGRSTSRGFCRK